MPNKSWKNFERETAKALGGKRVIRDYGSTREDVEHPNFSIECKYRKNIPKLITEGLRQAKRSNASKTPLLVVKQHNMKGAIVCMSLSDFTDWFGRL